MEYRRHPREPAPRGRRGGASATARTSAPRSPTSSRPSSSATRWPAAAPSSRPTSTTASWSRWRSAATSWSRSTPTSATRRCSSSVDRRGRQDGLGDPLGRRHHHGPVHRPQHPQHPRVDHPQLPDAARHRADLPGAGEGRRRRRGPDLGGVPRHPDRAGRAGGGLLHHPRRRAAALHPADRQAGHRHRLARRLDHGQVVPGPPPARTSSTTHFEDICEIMRAYDVSFSLGDGLRPGSHRRRQRRGPVRRAGDPGRADQGRLEARRAGDDRGPRPRADAQDQGQHGQAAGRLPRGAVLHARAR